MTEDELVGALRALAARPRARVYLGIGDDAAAWQPSRSHRSVVTTDAMVENVHFMRASFTMREIGARAMAAALSDVAAMGARPVISTVALGLPRDVERETVLELYRGLLQVADDAGCAIAGGDITRAPSLALAITAIGEVRASNLKTRSGARLGDVLAVTGELGASRAGLHGSRDDEAVAAHKTPQPRLREGRWLCASANVHAMMDLSDGLSTDLTRLCTASQCGALVESVPVARSAAAMARERGEDPLTYALAGGEDYELLVAVAPRAFAYLAARFRACFKRPLYRIGAVRGGSGVTLRTSGGDVPLQPSGWDSLEC